MLGYVLFGVGGLLIGRFTDGWRQEFGGLMQIGSGADRCACNTKPKTFAQR